uniref:Acyl-CoA-binding domain-containing protein 5 n=1 Tax=Neogobius melanostomus TaxID=47308 RepID=A0A8C6WP50_9GOBI
MEVESMPNMEEDRRLTLLRFEAAVKVIKSLPPDGPFQPSNDMMLKFYKFYKQATVGPCNIPRPGFWDAVGKAKWDAWNSLGDMSKEKAMASYVDEMKLILEGMPVTGEVEELLQVLGPFYELVEEKKKITQISDLSAGFGTMMNSLQTKSVAKDVVRTMELNGTLDTKPKFTSVMNDLSDEELLEEEEDDEVIQESKKERRSPKKKGSARRHVANGKMANGDAHLTNGNHSKAALNSGDSQEALELVLNGHHAAPNHVASDSDSEVYCDSIDQFGQEENSDVNRSIDDLEEGESPSLQHLAGPVQENVGPQGVQCGGEDGENAGPRQRPKTGGEMPGSSLIRHGRGPISHGPGLGPLAPMHSSGDGDGGNWGGAGTLGLNLDEQIVVALARLQEDMQSVLERLHTLEALTTSQARSLALSPPLPASPVNKKNRNPSWWPFDISPTSLAFAVIWPFVVQWLLRVFLHRRRRRIN